MRSVEVAQQLSINDATVRGWKRKYAYLLETVETLQIAETVETAKRETQTLKTVQRETVTETITETQNGTEGGKTPVAWGAKKVIAIALIFIALAAIATFQWSLNTSAFSLLGSRLQLDTLIKYAWVGAAGFCLGGFALAAFVQTDDFSDPNYKGVIAFVLIDAGLNLMTLVNFEWFDSKNWQIVLLGILVSVACPYVFYYLSKQLFSVINDPPKIQTYG